MRRLVLLVLLLGLVAPGLVGASGVAPRTPRAHEVRSAPATGALYYPSIGGVSPHLGGPHFCSASVVNSRTRDLVATAAHCVFGTGATIEFAPLAHDGKLPGGVWTVTALYIDPSWTTSFDPRHDVAILRVAPRGGKDLEDVVRGRRIGLPHPGKRVRVTGYPMGSDNRPVTCVRPLTRVHGYSAIGCRGFGAGTSGGPWVQRRRLVGVVGGLEQGGCAPDVEYSTRFGPDTRRLLRRAVAGGPGDIAPIGFTANAC